jgi:hypothetical protein
MKEEVVFTHLDHCPSNGVGQDTALTINSVHKTPAPQQCSSMAYTPTDAMSTGKTRDRLPTLAYRMLSDTALRKKLQALSISSQGLNLLACGQSCLLSFPSPSEPICQSHSCCPLSSSHHQNLSPSLPPPVRYQLPHSSLAGAAFPGSSPRHLAPRETPALSSDFLSHSSHSTDSPIRYAVSGGEAEQGGNGIKVGDEHASAVAEANEPTLERTPQAKPKT